VDRSGFTKKTGKIYIAQQLRFVPYTPAFSPSEAVSRAGLLGNVRAARPFLGCFTCKCGWKMRWGLSVDGR
jgi:hypothetical protein